MKWGSIRVPVRGTDQYRAAPQQSINELENIVTRSVFFPNIGGMSVPEFCLDSIRLLLPDQVSDCR